MVAHEALDRFLDRMGHRRRGGATHRLARGSNQFEEDDCGASAAITGLAWLVLRQPCDQFRSNPSLSTGCSEYVWERRP